MERTSGSDVLVRNQVIHRCWSVLLHPDHKQQQDQGQLPPTSLHPTTDQPTADPESYVPWQQVLLCWGTVERSLFAFSLVGHVDGSSAWVVAGGAGGGPKRNCTLSLEYRPMTERLPFFALVRCKSRTRRWARDACEAERPRLISIIQLQQLHHLPLFLVPLLVLFLLVLFLFFNISFKSRTTDRLNKDTAFAHRHDQSICIGANGYGAVREHQSISYALDRQRCLTCFAKLSYWTVRADLDGHSDIAKQLV